MLKDAPPGQLAEAVRAVASGESLLAPAVTRRLIERYVATPPPGAARSNEHLSELTERELEVFELIARGCSNREIAEQLFLSEATVKTHVTRIFAKLELRDRVQAVVLADELGLVTPGESSQGSGPLQN
jgi:DNA-binding NarL/FixJ family response regulator